MNHVGTCALSLSLAIASLPLAAQRNVVMQAMQDEMARSMNELRLDNLEKPYFVSYTVYEVSDIRATAALGGIASSGESAGRTLSVEVRVGDRTLDNTNFYSRPDFRSLGFTSGRAVSLPLDDNYDGLRRAIWLATDRAYKQALDQISKKRALLQNETVVEEAPDFSVEDPHQYDDGSASPTAEANRVRALAADLSAVFLQHPNIHASAVEARATRVRVLYANSEGSSIIREDPSAAVSVRAGARAGDGTEISDSFTVYGRTSEDLPGHTELAARGQVLAGRLEDLRQAQIFDRYAGPVLFEGQAAAELLAQLLVSRLVGRRPPDTEATPGFSMSVPGGPFADKIGARVLARSLSLRDDPTLLGGGFLGGFKVDDEGVPAQATSLVENGVLKTLLTTRNPVRGVDGSTGNRRGSSPAPSNLLLTSRRGMSQEDMLDELMLLVEERQAEYGIIVRRMGNPGFQPTSDFRSFVFSSRTGVENAILAYKVYPDGREELIRKAEFSALADSIFKEVLAASESSTVYTFLYPLPRSTFQVGVPGLNGHLVSVSVPDLLFEELTLRKPTGNVPHLPVASHPFFGE